jgi:cystathionine gamma-synthase
VSASTQPEPPCRADDLGRPIPDSPHAISVCLPLWEHNVGYEEGDPGVIDRMQAGYPRFFLNPLVQQLFDGVANSFGGGCACFAFPSKSVALRCQQYVQTQLDAHLLVDAVTENVWVVIGPPEAADIMQQFWQHGGEIVSSRAAEIALAGQSPTISECNSKRTIRQRVASLNGCDPRDIYLFPSGMAAIYLAWRVCRRFRPDMRSVQFGFPYVDTLKLQQRFVSDGVRFFPHGDQTELAGLKSLVSSEPIQAVFCESPTNPLLVTPDIPQLRILANEHGFPLVVDDTVGALINTETLSYSDLMTTSLTKFFSGAGDVLAGSLIVNPNGPHAKQLRTLVDDEYEDLFYDCDADVLAKNSADAAQRVQRINTSAEAVADYLFAHPAVDQLFYPKFTTRDAYESILKPGGGFGGLFSMTLKQPDAAPHFYDALAIAKGPNLGTNFSLACPYTILAHYDELEFAESCGVSRNLVRVSIGLEDTDWLIQRFAAALSSC